MKILVIRFSSIGDIVLTTPVLRCLKRQTAAEIHVLTKQRFSEVLSANPYVDRIHTFETNLDPVLHDLKRERFDHVIDLHHNLRSFQVKWALGRPFRSFNKLNAQKWLLVNTGINLLPDQHIVERYMATVEHLGVRYDGQGLDHFIPDASQVDLSALLPGWKAGHFVAFVIGATHATKRLPPEKMLEICRNINSPVAILGGRAEAGAGAWLAENAGNHVIDLCGRLDIHQSASVVQQSGLVLTHDTGLMHIAAALRKRIVSVWGSTVPAFGMYPFYPEGMELDTPFEVAGLSCRPCSKIGYPACPKGHFRCMYGLDSEQLAQACSI